MQARACTHRCVKGEGEVRRQGRAQFASMRLRENMLARSWLRLPAALHAYRRACVSMLCALLRTCKVRLAV